MTKEDRKGHHAPVTTFETSDRRRPEVSRRAILVGTSTAAFGAAMPADAAFHVHGVAALSSDEGTQRCVRWLETNAEIQRLQARWDKVETSLAKKHAWYELTVQEQSALSHAEDLRALDRQLETLFQQRDDLSKAIASSATVSVTSVIARLAVAEQLLSPFEDAEVHALIAGARRDLMRFSEGSQTI